MLCLAAKADVPVFGTTTNGDEYAFQLGEPGGGSALGGAVEFTPAENLDVSSVTLWLTGYNAQNYSFIWADLCATSPIAGINQPGATLAFSINPEPNDGSIGAFTFNLSSGPITLDAGQEYWLLAAGYYQNPQAGGMPLWVNGEDPTGDANYDGADFYTSGLFGTGAPMPAFTINVVPEPSEYALGGLGAVLLGFRRWRKWQ